MCAGSTHNRPSNKKIIHVHFIVVGCGSNLLSKLAQQMSDVLVDFLSKTQWFSGAYHSWRLQTQMV